MVSINAANQCGECRGNTFVSVMLEFLDIIHKTRVYHQEQVITGQIVTALVREGHTWFPIPKACTDLS